MYRSKKCTWVTKDVGLGLLSVGSPSDESHRGVEIECDLVAGVSRDER